MKTAIETRPNQAQSNQAQFRRVRPAVDVYESDTEYLVSVELPGVKNEDIALTLEQDSVRLEATRRAFLTEPILYDRTFALPEFVNRDEVNAQLKDGVLALKLPKRPSHQPRQIQIGAA